MSELIALAERVEAASGPDRLLNRDIAEAIGLGPDETWRRPLSTPGIIDLDEDSWIKGGIIRRAKPYTASLDAAMTLVPEGWTWSSGEDRNDRPGFARCTGPEPLAFRDSDHIRAATPALALTAAALRARAHREKSS